MKRNVSHLLWQFRRYARTADGEAVIENVLIALFALLMLDVALLMLDELIKLL